MRFVYNILFFVFFALSAPYYLLKMWRRGNWSRGFSYRYGRYGGIVKMAVTNRHVIWLHAVSVGEVNILTQLLRVLEPRVPNAKIVVSTTTSTGMELLEKNLPQRILKIYYPLDFPWMVDRAFKVLHPETMVLIEAEIWPNFLWKAADRNKPIFLVNARLSERSYRGYKMFGFLFRRLFASLAGVGCQNEADAQRLRELGCRPEAIHVVGNLKFDAARLHDDPLFNMTELLAQVGVPKNPLILIGGSTHDGEEAILAQVYNRLKKKYPNLYLILVPRHFERARAAAKQVADAGLNVIYRTEITSRTAHAPGTVDCLLVNTTGELRFFYEHADVVFVGKSLTAEGGQNPIEPGAMGKAIVFGPHMQNFTAISTALVERKGALQVQDVAGLETALDQLLGNEDFRKATGKNALAVVNENLGSARKTVKMILDNLRHTELYIEEEHE
jgi:3-deoxy-D-manno-octulosonic-acid transferase